MDYHLRCSDAKCKATQPAVARPDGPFRDGRRPACSPLAGGEDEPLCLHVAVGRLKRVVFASMSGILDPLEPFDPRLRRRMEARARREFEVAESEAALLAARRRRLADVAWEAIQSGSRIRIRVGRRELAGTPTYARNDLMTLETGNGQVDVYLPNVDALSVVPESTLGRSVPKGVETFRARVSMLQLSKKCVEIVCRGGETRFGGEIEYVARDHLSLRTARGPAMIALEAIAYLTHGANVR